MCTLTWIHGLIGGALSTLAKAPLANKDRLSP